MLKQTVFVANNILSDQSNIGSKFKWSNCIIKIEMSDSVYMHLPILNLINQIPTSFYAKWQPNGNLEVILYLKIAASTNGSFFKFWLRQTATIIDVSVF